MSALRCSWLTALLLGACGPAGSHGVVGPPGGAALDGGPGAPAPQLDAGVPDAAPLSLDDGLDVPPMHAWLKGQLHLHSLGSPDSDYPGEMVVEFYQQRGYDFIVFTDHNVVSQLAASGDMLVLPGVELTYNTTECEPPPEKKKCLVHVNALFVRTPSVSAIDLPAPESLLRIDLYQRFLDEAARLDAVAMLNHPNFQWTVDAALAYELGRRGMRLFEFANQGMPISNPGDATHPSTEAMWDTVLTGGVTMWGVATDDAHDYDWAQALHENGDEFVYPGDLGWVMVLAARDGESIRGAVERGDFYASTGVLLARLEVDAGALHVRAAGRGAFRVEFVGAGGVVLDAVPGREASIALARAAGGYVRARVFGEGGKMAWSQPIRVP